MNTTKRVVASLGVAVAAAAAPAVLFVGSGTASADDCYGSMAYSYYCSPASQSGGYSSDPGISYTPIQPAFGYSSLPQCSGGGLAGIFGALSGDGC